MKKLFIFIVCCFLPFALYCQPPVILKPEAHTHYLQLLGSAKDSLYNTILQSFDRYIRNHPEEYLVQIERCKLIENAYYDSYTESNPKYEESEECLDQLLLSFPKIPEVVLYKAEGMYGDSAIIFLETILSDYDQEPEKWENKGISKVYSKLAESYSRKDQNLLAIKFAALAVKNNDTLDLSLLLARQYKALKQNKNAIDVLVNNLHSKNETWTLNEKGKLLLELGVPDKAILAFRLAKKDSSSWQDAGGLARAMIENGLFADARPYLVKDIEDSWKKSSSMRKLFEYDLKHSHADSALASYTALVKENFWNDPVGINRIQLLFHGPLLHWSFYDVLRIFLMLLLLITILIVPYILILPVHYLGNYFKNKGMLLKPTEFRWGLRHFWLACSLLLLVDIMAMLIYYFDETFVNGGVDGVSPINNNLANMSLFVMIGLLLATVLLTKKSDLAFIWGKIWDKKKSILSGIGMAFLLRFGLGIYLKIYAFLGIGQSDAAGMVSVIDEIVSVNQYYHPLVGFVFVVILVPFYEEFLFRGIFLSSCQKYMKFFIANSIQSVIFALLHQDIKLLPFFFAFGFVAGYYREKSQSLAPGISMHITNNLLAFIGILAGRR